LCVENLEFLWIIPKTASWLRHTASGYLSANEVATSMSYQLIKSDSTICPVKAPETDSKDKPAKKTDQKISRQQLVNKLNYLNFQDKTILINFKHKKFGHAFASQAKPRPCLGEEVICDWVDSSKIKSRLKTYDIESILLKDRQWNLELRLELLEVNDAFVHFKIPEIYYQFISRRTLREPCRGVRAQMIQNSVIFEGALIDFCASEFSIKIRLEPPQTSQWINPDVPVNILLAREKETIFSGECKIVKEDSNGDTIAFLLEPASQNIQRFKSKKFRSTREAITPEPIIRFTHPLTGNVHDFNVIDLSGSGFSVEETDHTRVLLPGMILPDVQMRFANSFKIKFKAQVIHCRKPDSTETGVLLKYGLVLLDISTHDHLKMQSALLQLRNKNSYVCDELDVNSLWNFLFETGFIYPEKYTYIEKNSDNIKNTYEKIYLKSPSIARHFTYKNKGLIAGHLSMIRFYEDTWLIHHHAGRKSSAFNAGLIVLNQIGHFSNNSHSLYSNHMKYLICYFRPENKFPNRVFGGAARTINDEKKCDIKPFAYFHFNGGNNPTEKEFDISLNWSLKPSTSEDIEELEAFYSHNYNGLMLKALNIESSKIEFNGLSDEYKKLGLKRERHFFSLKNENSLVAIFMVNISNKGLNLSDLTSGVTAIILDSDNLSENSFKTALYMISAADNMRNFPVMVYPENYMTKHSVQYEKTYNLWMLDTQYGDNYFRYVNRLTRLA
jgi:hypothetical protein